MTKRAQRIRECLPDDWEDGWDHVTFSVSCENQQRLEERMPYLLELPSKHKWVSLKPFIGEIDIEEYLATGQIETVLAGSENYLGSRPLYYEWVKKCMMPVQNIMCSSFLVRQVISSSKTVKNTKSIIVQTK